MDLKAYRLTLIEDSEDDALLFTLALRRSGLATQFNLVRHFANGEDAMHYFSQAAAVEMEPRSDIVILDLKLPGRSGFQVLQGMQSLLHKPTVAIFTSSCLACDRELAERLGADLFQPKTFDVPEFARFLQWLGRLVDQRRGSKL